MRKVMTIVLGLFVLFAVGCSTNTASAVNPSKEISKVEVKIPEPYTTMVKKLNEPNPNLDSALDFANLTIKDFPATPYAYNAHFVRSLILLGQDHAYLNMGIYLGKGIDHMGVLSTSADVDVVKGFLKKIDVSEKTIVASLDESLRYILENYKPENKIDKIDFPTSDVKIIKKSEYTSFNWFADIGTPVPKQSDYDDIVKNIPQKAFYLYMNTVETSNEINYPKYFLTGSFRTFDKDLQKKLLNKVLALTENDKYNESRIEAEKDLKDFK